MNADPKRIRTGRKEKLKMKKILALVLSLVLVVCAAFALAEEVKVLTHEEFMAYTAPEGEEEVAPITIETYVQAHQSWWDGKVSVYAQSEDGGRRREAGSRHEDPRDRLQG